VQESFESVGYGLFETYRKVVARRITVIKFCVINGASVRMHKLAKGP